MPKKKYNAPLKRERGSKIPVADIASKRHSVVNSVVKKSEEIVKVPVIVTKRGHLTPKETVAEVFQFVADVYGDGRSIEAILSLMGLSLFTFYRWRRQHPDLVEQMLAPLDKSESPAMVKIARESLLEGARREMKDPEEKTYSASKFIAKHYDKEAVVNHKSQSVSINVNAKLSDSEKERLRNLRI